MNARNRASLVFSLLPFSPAPFPLTLNVYALPLLFAIFFSTFSYLRSAYPFPIFFFPSISYVSPLCRVNKTFHYTRRIV